MAQLYTDIMVDLETTSTLPDRGSILQIAAVKFNLKDNTVSPDFFNISLTMPKHRCWDEGTRNWWLSQKEGVLSEILQNQVGWEVAIERFADYSYPANHLRFWSKPSHFDFNFLSSYFHDKGLANPFHYREATDMNSFLRGLYAESGGYIPDTSHIEMVGDAHNALWDTFHQVKILLHHVHVIKREGGKVFDPTLEKVA